EGKLLAVVTQNIDGLHFDAGSKRVYELHGSVRRNYCTRCGKFFSAQEIAAGTGVPRCDCGGIVKPDVVLYGEPLDESTVNGAVRAISKADTLIVAGTSLTVYPAAAFVDSFRGRHLVLINRDPTPLDGKCELVLRGKVGEILSEL
ncbi:MAG: Sir2 family NAD-dependent protein deacetylase, partial [Candidatus Gallimonas sp.]